MEKRLIYSGIQTPDGKILSSRYTHDFKMYKDTVSLETYILDGGLSYVRTSINKVPAKNLSVYNTDAIEKIREVFTWGTYGKSGTEELNYIKLKDMSNAHIIAIKEKCELDEVLIDIFDREMSYRNTNNIIISDKE